jgi:hypothetical protein
MCSRLMVDTLVGIPCAIFKTTFVGRAGLEPATQGL